MIMIILAAIVALPATHDGVAAARLATIPEMSFETLVTCQQAIETVYWQEREWPAANFQPKPALDAVMPAAAIQAKAHDAVAKSNALAVLWQSPISSAQLQAEMDRMALSSKRPDLLAKLFSALGNDPVMIAECLARPLLADRLIRERYASDRSLNEVAGQGQAFDDWWATQRSRFVSENTAPAASYSLPRIPEQVVSSDFWTPTQSLPERTDGSIVWTGSEMIVWGGGALSGTGKFKTGSRYNPGTDTWTPVTTIDAPLERGFHTAVWTGSEMIIWGGCGPFEWRFCSLANGARYNPQTDTWTVIGPGAPSSRLYHSAVWTGSEMIVWGGCSYGTSGASCHDRTDAGRYSPSSDTWTSVTMAGGPSPRSGHSAVWTGSSMLVWGGDDGLGALADGGIYDPVADSWSPMSTTNSPGVRSVYSAVWTGEYFVVWGGCPASYCLPSSIAVNTGARYHLASDTWTPINLASAPAARYGHSAVWTGSEMILWGGAFQGGARTNDGARYNPTTDTWTGVTNVSGAPIARASQHALWTGSLMIIWGGDTASLSGGRYDPASDSWMPTNANSSQYALSGHKAVWTGAEMLVWGGDGSPTGQANIGDRYDPATDSWTTLSAAHSLFYRYAHTAIWTGTEMIVWGGQYGTSTFGDGARYNPMTNSWTPVSAVNAPTGRSYHTAVWTGSAMIIWGGQTEISETNTGGRYDPASDSWSATSTVNAPSARYIHSAVWTGDTMIVWGGSAGNLGDSAGGRYNPVTNTWLATSMVNAPPPRYFHTAVWSGDRMIVFGGRVGGISNATYHNSGGRYDPVNDTWSATTLANAPSPRSNHTSVWTGDEMIVWGGCSGSTCLTETYTGARYDPAGDVWATTALPGVPAMRSSHTAVWTGNGMIVWGGTSDHHYQTSGGVYFLATCAGYDLTCDGVTDVLDIILVANRWNCLLGAPCYLDRFDLNADDAITIADAMIVAGAWNAP